MKSIKDSYNNIKTNKVGPLYDEEPTSVRTFVPNPINLDYERSYIYRYFIRKLNDENATIYEVDDRRISEYRNNPLYTYVTIEWKISKDSIENVKIINRKSIMEGQKRISNLHLYLPNLTQFYKDIEY
jgi:hypothetical protein